MNECGVARVGREHNDVLKLCEAVAIGLGEQGGGSGGAHGWWPPEEREARARAHALTGGWWSSG